MLQASQRTPQKNLPTQPLPILVVADQESEFAIFETDPTASCYPEIASAGAPFAVIVHAFGHPESVNVQGVIRWRPALTDSWHEEPLSRLESQKWIGEWTPPSVGSYEWNIELWIEEDSGDCHRKNQTEEIRLLRAERPDLMKADWYQLPRTQFSKSSVFSQATQSDVFVLPPIFPTESNGTIGKDGLGHYSIDHELGNAVSFGKLAAKLCSRGITLAMTIPLHCSPTHPFRIKDPSNFSSDGIPNLISEGWQERRTKWESVFRYWIVQGIEVFDVQEVTRFPLSFWDNLIRSLRIDFPHIAFVTSDTTSTKISQKMLSAGFSDFHKSLIKEQDPTELTSNQKDLLDQERQITFR